MSASLAKSKNGYMVQKQWDDLHYMVRLRYLAYPPPASDAGLGGQGGANAPPMPSQGGQNRVLPPPNIGEKLHKKGDFWRRLRRREKIFPKNPLFSENLPPNNFPQLRL